MNNKELELLIEKIVYKKILKIFAEMKLESIVENVVSRKITSKQQSVIPRNEKLSVKKVFEQEENFQNKPTISAEEKRKMIIEKIGGDDMWKNIYADTATSNNPIIEGDEGAEQEQVPLNILENMGLIKDYSKHIGVNNKTVDKEDEEWQKRREARAKILGESIKRA